MDWSGSNQVSHKQHQERVPVHGDLQRTRSLEPHDHPKNNRGHKRHRYYKYILAVIISGSFPSQTLGRDYWGCFCYASPVANRLLAVLRTKQFRYYKDPTLRILMGEGSNVKVPQETLPRMSQAVLGNETL